MTGEKNGQCRSRPQLSLRARYDGAAQRADERIVIGLLVETVRDGKSEHAFRVPNRSHEAEPR